jgi:hypothetical protein
MLIFEFLDQRITLTNKNEHSIKSLMSKYPPETKVTIWNKRGTKIIQVLQIDEIFNL